MRDRVGVLSIVVTLVATLVVTISPVAVNAASGLTATQQQGFTTLKWVPDTFVGITGYEIERTPVDAANAPTGPAVIAGIWRPDRQVNQAAPAFADAGYQPGLRFGWRVRALRMNAVLNVIGVQYAGQSATWSPNAPVGGLVGPLQTVNGGGANPGQGCGPITNDVAGKIAVIDRGTGNTGTCSYTIQVVNAQNAGAIAVVIVNNVAGDPVAPGGTGAGVAILRR